MLVGSILWTKFLYKSSIILLECPTEYHIDGGPLHLAFQALFDDIRGELELAEADEVGGDHAEDLVVAARIVELEHVLHQVVAEGVLYQAVQVVDDHVGEGQLLLLSPLLQATLHHTATVLVGTYLYTVLDAGVEDKLGEALEVLGSLTVWLLWVLRSFKNA